MQKITLTEFIDKHGQTGAAEKLGMTQPSIRKAMLAGREIYVTENEDGSFSAEEIRPFPSIEQKARAS